jgi:pimeloyl-ACP methyl ester carboxylesterase
MTEQISVFKTMEGETKSMTAYDAALARWPVPYEERYLPTRFGTTHLIVSGPADAEPIIFLHGQDSCAISWIDNIPAFSKEFRAYAIDTLGDIGKSRPVRQLDSREDYAGWLLEILDGLGIEKAGLIGLSYGGFLATNFALAHPARVSRVALLAPGIPNFGPPTLQWANYGLPMMFLPSQFTVSRFLNGASTKGYSHEDPVHQQMIIGLMNMRKLSFMRPVFTDGELKGMTVPVLLLLGDHEIMYEPRKALDLAAGLIPGLQAELIPDAGHILNSDQPKLVNARILEFFQA